MAFHCNWLEYSGGNGGLGVRYSPPPPLTKRSGVHIGADVLKETK
ncbi:hypothetical protein OH492_26395 [Vibrio chagasii]|nr:hypothetical protein [Vibrio chagasii]